MDLTGKVALVTGANSGIGKAIAIACGKAGADVAINYVASSDTAEEVRREIDGLGRRVMTVKADISQDGQVKDMVSQVIDKLGMVDILVNNAGLQTKKGFLDLTIEDWDKMLSVDLRGTFLVTLHTAREMAKAKSGRIIFITSVHQTVPKSGYASYCVAKAGEGMMTKVLSDELAPYNINVNAVAPGAVNTPMNKVLMENPELKQKLLDEIPIGRVGQPDEIANLVVFLASSAADYITGATYVIDGGLSQRGAKY